MSITPLDLQMLFAQMDKLAKDTHAQKDGAALHKAMETAAQQKLNSERLHAVHEAETGGADINSLQNEKSGADAKQNPKQHKDSEPRESGEEKAPPVRDPNLGRYIDLTG